MGFFNWFRKGKGGGKMCSKCGMGMKYKCPVDGMTADTDDHTHMHDGKHTCNPVCGGCWKPEAACDCSQHKM